MNKMNDLGGYAINLIKLLVLVSIIIAWATKIPYGQISEFVGTHFPWPESQSAKWPALLIEHLIIEVVICIPVAFLLARFYHQALYIGLFLVFIFILRASLDLQSPLSLPYSNAFVIYGVIIHLILLIGGIFAFRKRLQSTPQTKIFGQPSH